tara:strand:- start:20 stop:304 length:285 start_codon:yes stop_codon:yes gene_type:complete
MKNKTNPLENQIFEAYRKKQKELEPFKKIPSYYIGKNQNRNIQARHVVSDFDLTYNIGTAVTYLLRSSRKHKTPIEDLKKAMAHLEFELERLNE